MFKPCVMIPVYDHEHAIGAVVEAVLAHGLPCMLVDDGSKPSCARVLDQLAAAHPGTVVLVRHAVNQGKGAAVLTGFRSAAQAGYTHLLQVDADGQHNTDDIPRFVALARLHPHAVIAGCPVYDQSVPKLRLYGRYLTHVWIWINTLSFAIRDSMCGFRIYPVAPVLSLDARCALGKRMNFDSEILVRLFWDEVQVVNLPTRVTYPSDGVSHFMAFRDNVLISRMHTVLFFGMLIRLPKLLARKWRSA
ncbi:glycosyltransferase family 2 protein [Massilia antarctica]|uniref:glycosyltransferase family 2 protein n=1 Tax=Massilia antarctica TaxID=2765360 RepID=UPI0006BB94B8|nr:glycosyltransferase family 2 protein [Massilia sp. H27-R4]MCY0912511.1 glycosyltransferase family 2 protein [Massilia sp. H27-R4]CUI03558.1 FIG143263: Glycosyl transferase [Janthinobacterium sp. CG23_2]CUU27344.1 FIG143263: Glycosyl transferase [Janthinobacterium sp. CG23_2]